MVDQKKNYFKRRNKDRGPKTNNRINSPEVQVISSSGENLGILNTNEAISIAKEEGLDLIEISPNARPPVCKIMDMGKFKYDALKKANQGVTVNQGSQQEMKLGEFLKKIFKNTEDKITPYGKGVSGADWLQEVIEKGETICRILYESKSTKGWSNEWLGKLQEDMQDSKANIGIIFSRALPKNFNKDDEFSHTGNIFICKYNYSTLKVLATTQRWLLTQLNKERKNGKENTLSALKFLEEPDVKNSLTQIIVKSYTGKKKIKKDSRENPIFIK